MQVHDGSPLGATHSHARTVAESLLRRYSEDSVYGSTSFSRLEDDSDPVSSLCFLVQLGDRLDDEGNFAESIRCAECALVVRHSHRIKGQDVQDWLDLHPREVSPESQEVIGALLASEVTQAKALVLRCNALAVREFNAQHFDVASYYLAKALHLTSKRGEPVLTVLARTTITTTTTPTSIDGTHSVEAWLEGSDTGSTLSATEASTLGTLCFRSDDEERRRLQAATCNNAGCMERRRGRPDVSLLYLREAASIEVQLDATGQSSASTYLNLCTVLNELHHYAEAVVTAERACNALQLAILEQSEEEEVAKLAMMLAVGQYNLGVSLERRAQPGDQAAAERAYQQCLHTSQRYLVDQACPSVEAAVDAIRRLKDPRRASVVQRRTRDHSQAAETVEEATPAASHTTPLVPPTRPSPPSVTRVTAAVSVPAPGSSSNSSSVVAPFSWVPPTSSSSKRAKAKGPETAAARLPQLPLHGLNAALTEGTAADGKGRTASPTERTSASAPATRTSGSGGSGLSAAPPPLLAATQNTLFQPPPLQAQRGRVSLPPKYPPVLAPLPVRATATPTPPATAKTSTMTHPFASTMPAASPFRAASRPSGASMAATQQRGASGSSHAAPPRLSTATARMPPGSNTVSAANPLGRRTFGSAALAGTADSSSGPSGALGRSGLSRPVSSSTAAGRASMDPATAQAKRLQERFRRETRRRKEKEVAQHDSSVADALHQQMVQGMKREEMRRCHAAATAIQAVWRGVLARTFIATMMTATLVLQRAVRRFLVRRRAEHRLEAEERVRQQALREQQERAAASVLQARVRQFLRRCHILREYRASRMRTFYAARTIQRGYRVHRTRLAEHVAAVAEAHRREDLQREFTQRVAAKRIQRAYHVYQARKVEVLAQQGRQRRHQAATAIQAAVRGVLTRSWFRYYKAYRRDQEVRSAANQRRLTLIQACCRATLSMQLIRQRRLDQLTAQRQRQLDLAATRLQCMWRSHVARIRFERLQAERARLDRRATLIQRWYRMCHERRAFLKYRDGMQRLRAALRIQRWLREQRQLAKEREFAAYHAEQLRRARVAQQREQTARLVQACLLARDSDVLVASMRRDFLKREWCACVWQRVGRGYAARRDVALTLAVSRVVAEKDRIRAEQTAAVLILQRAWRCAAAKDTVEQRRRERAAARVIANNGKIFLAKKELRALRAQRDAAVRDAAARKIQHAVRAAQQHRREAETTAYYRGKHNKKMHTLRRQEAATMIQSVWRGHVTRRAVAEERAVLQALGVFAARIQRAWRSRRFRQHMTRELQVRAVERRYYDREALVIQCFWRKMQAAEKVAQLREAQADRARAALVLQCWWRQALARRAALTQYLLRQEEEELALFYALKWERACTVVNAFLRARLSALHTREAYRLDMLSQLHLEGRVRFLLRESAATRIQATYRGHYERVYVRGLRREKAEEARRAAEEAERQRRAALCIQCAWRCRCARVEMRRLRDAKLNAILQSQEDYLATADPEEIVRELFWAEAAVAKRQFTEERLQRQRVRQEAATKIQKTFRSLTSSRAVQNVLQYKAYDKAARTIQSHWRAFKLRATARQSRQQEQATIILQRYVRGWLVRKEWVPWRQAMEQEQRATVATLDRYDHAATVVQAAWRRVLAQRYTAFLRQVLQEEKDEAAREEAAALIQEAYREHLMIKRAQTI